MRLFRSVREWGIVAAVVIFVAASIAAEGSMQPTSPEMLFTDSSSQGLQIVPASGGSAPAQPTMYPAQCNGDNTATLSWGVVSGAEAYGPRYRYTPIGCAAGWYEFASTQCARDDIYATSVTIPIVYNYNYGWWVHTYAGGVGSGWTEESFACANPAPSCTLSVSPTTVNQPGSAMLSWSSSSAESFYISNVSYVTPNTSDSTSVAPSQTTVYTGTVTNEYTTYNGSAVVTVTAENTCNATLTVNRSCTFNGNTITHGNSVTAYQAATVPYGSSCASQTRTCTDGTLSGTYAYSSCTPNTAPDFEVTVEDVIAMGSRAQLAAGAATEPIRKKVKATLLSGAPMNVSFAVSGVPATGVTYSINPPSCQMSCESSLVFNFTGDAPTGSHTITITATAGPAVKTTTFSLNIPCATSSVYSCVGGPPVNNIIRRTDTNAACTVTTTDKPACVSPSYCAAPSSECLTNRPAFIESTGDGNGGSGSIVFTGSLQSLPRIVAPGARAKLYWNVSNVSSCTVSENNPTIFDSFSPDVASGAGGRPTSEITQTTTYTLNCTPEDGTPFDPVSTTILITPSFQER